MSEEDIVKIITYMLNMQNTDVNIIVNYEAIKGLLELYKKQQKEIKHQRQQKKYWRDNFYEQQKEIKKYKEAISIIKTKPLSVKLKDKKGNVIAEMHDPLGYISKDKIRKKIKEIKLQADVYGIGGELSRPQLDEEQEAQINILKELLKENINE